MRVRAIWNGVILAESENTRVVEGNHYFPPDSINQEYFKENERHTVCPWKGTASYYDVVVDGKINSSAAWYYPNPSQAANDIKDYVAFWNGVKVEKINEDGEIEGPGGVRGLLSSFLGNR